MYDPGKAQALKTFKKTGFLDLERLVKEDRVTLSDTPISKTWFKADDWGFVFTGQIKNKKPNGFVRIIWQIGVIEECFMDEKWIY